MSEEFENQEDNENQNDNSGDQNGNMGQVIPVSGMYKDWFLDYASYVILERAVPALLDGLKPVQRRILHAMDDLDDGRYNKVANIIGHTMKYHPHGDASIGDALVQIGQKDLLVDCQGNWGNILTGDSAAAPRYIEARLSNFAKEVVFNPKTTNWQLSYDGRNREPINLPVKFPLLLAQGAEGIAVGMACKILPHNFNEIIDACVAYLKGKNFEIYPDFPTGGMADVSNYNDGLRGGRVRVRAKIKKEDKRTLAITEIPYGTNTSNLIESIIKANDKGKIKVKKIEDNTAAEVEILVHLHNDVSPDQMIDALYAFTDCEMSLAPNAAVIENNEKPKFMGVKDMLRQSADGTVALLKLELEIRLNELQEQWHFSSLEKIFIENRIYRDIEECETWEAVLEAIDKGLKPHTKHLIREVTQDDIIRLTEIKIKRISKFDSFKADEAINKLEDAIAEVKNHLAHLIDFAIAYYQNIKKKYGKGRERLTELRQFDTIEATRVVVSNRKLYVDATEGFVGYGLKKAEFVADCSDIDDVIVFRNNGTMMVSKVQDKAFFGKDIIHVGIWKKGDDRTIYNMVYQDGKAGATMMKRFAVTSITRDKEYDLTAGTAGSKVLYFTANPNGEAEILNVLLRPRPHLKKLRLEINFADLAIKGRGAKGNILTKHLISKISQKESLGSTLDAREIWYDESVKRLNDDERGRSLGKFRGNDKILVVYKAGYYRMYEPKLTLHFDEGIQIIEKYDASKVATVVYFDAERSNYYLKRFELEENDKENYVISEAEGSEMLIFSFYQEPKLTLHYDKRSGAKVEEEEVMAHEFISVKGMKALGNKLTSFKIKNIDIEETYVEPEIEEEGETEESGEDGQPSLF